MPSDFVYGLYKAGSIRPLSGISLLPFHHSSTSKSWELRCISVLSLGSGLTYLFYFNESWPAPGWFRGSHSEHLNPVLLHWDKQKDISGSLSSNTAWNFLSINSQYNICYKGICTLLTLQDRRAVW